MTRPSYLAAASIVAVTALGFFLFPGRTFLQSDTQIYLPILERLWNPSVLANDLIAEYPHVSFTIYDEVLFALRSITHANFEHLLMVQQFVYRALGVFGIYLLVTGFGLRRRYAILVAAVTALGATVNGPAVLTVEYEPVPRGFALPFVMLALGLIAHDRWDAAAVAAGMGFLMHPPTTLTFFAIYLGVSLWRKRIDVDALLIGAAAIMLVFVLAQRAYIRPEDLFATISPWLETLQRMRASYNWVETWVDQWFWHYAIQFAVYAVAFWRVRERIRPVLRAFLIGLPVTGVLSVPASWIFLSKMKLAVMPQLQPGRYLLFVTLCSVLLAAVAAVDAGIKNRRLEALGFFTFCFIVPIQPDLLHGPASRWALALALAACAMLACWADATSWSKPALAIACLAPFFAIPTAGVQNYPQIQNQDLATLSDWARTSTAATATFQFADLGQRLEPGVFRVRALRPVYADWKGGGQVNYRKDFAEVWWTRWSAVRKTQAFEVYGPLGIDYVVYLSRHRLANKKPVYQNSTYAVYPTR